MTPKLHGYDKVVYLMQGGGALGAYQVGVCQGLMEFGCEPNWIIGTSIGSINAGIIAGNKPEDRILKLKKFWEMIASPLPVIPWVEENYAIQQWQKALSSFWTICFGQPGFFKPRFFNPCFNISGYPEQTSFYDTSELKHTLEKVIDFNLLNNSSVRLTLAALCLEDSELVYFDNAKQELGPEHIMASSALPPGFPAIRISGKNYWDGGLSSNTPLNALLLENIKNKLMCIMVNLYSYHQHIPTNIWEVIKIKKDIELSSRYHQLLKYLYEIKRLHNLLHGIVLDTPEVQNEKGIKKIIGSSFPITLNIVRFQYQDHPSNLWTKDFEFSPQTLEKLISAGYKDVQEALKVPNWLNPIPEDHVVLHEF